MGNSQIQTILSAVAALSPTPSSDTVVNVETLATARDLIQEHDLPLRRLESIQMTAEIEYIAMGTTISPEWAIVDQFYYRVAGQGRGWQDWSAELIAYMQSYTNTMRTSRGISSQSTILGWTLTPDIYEFPENSGNRFAGVRAVVRVREVIT